MTARAVRVCLPPRKTAVSRADLLWLLHAQTADEACRNAALLGFVDHDEPEEAPAAPAAVTPPAKQAAAASAPAPSPRHFAVVEAQRRVAADTPPDAAAADATGSVYTSFTVQRRAPARIALSPRYRLAVFLNQTLRTPRCGRQIDLRRLLVDLARHHLPPRLPRRMQPHWSAQAALVIDVSLASAPLHADLIELAEHAHALSGGRLPVYSWSPAGGWCLRLPGSKPAWGAVGGEALCGARHWLLAGDGGSLANAGQCAGGLAALCRAHLAAGGRLTLLGGGPPDDGAPLLTARNCRYVAWEHGQRLRGERFAARRGVDENALARLLAALSLAVVVEPELLRALRLALGVSTAGELAAWNHADSEPCLLGTQLRHERLADHRRYLRGEELPLRRRLAKIVASRHVGESLLIQLEEQALAADLAELDAAQAGERWARAVRTLQRAAHGATESTAGAAACELAAYLGRCGLRAHATLWQTVPQLADAYVIARRDRLQAGEALPDGLPAASLERHLWPPGDKPAARRWHLLQHGHDLLLAGEDAPSDTFVLAEGDAASGIEVETPARRRQWHSPPLAGEVVVLGDLQQAGTDTAWVVTTAHERFVVREVPRPAWALRWERDQQGLYALAPSPLGPPARLDWRAGDDAAACWPPRTDGYSAVPRELAPGVVLGADLAYGLYADLTIAGVVQRFRWIAPGEFWMGSPASEAGRYANEGPRHRVRITQGFWLADTACTQALWRAVMHGNPSRFADDDSKPVEKVSWDDVQAFLRGVDKLLRVVRARLPSEAEWEYACRAGSKTVYSCGDGITHEQANFAAKRGGTVAVKSFPPNRWGLYEMHGNVWEWCADRQRTYGAAAQDDPRGPEPDAWDSLRVVRGGSWLHGARWLRSAWRNAWQRDWPNDHQGFRFALRSPSPERDSAAERQVGAERQRR